jgi:hypothetical protein
MMSSSLLLEGCVNYAFSVLILCLFGADWGFWNLEPQAAGPKLTAGLNIGLLLRESVESVAYNQDPGRGKEGIHDYGQTEAR